MALPFAMFVACSPAQVQVHPDLDASATLHEVEYRRPLFRRNSVAFEQWSTVEVRRRGTRTRTRSRSTTNTAIDTTNARQQWGFTLAHEGTATYRVDCLTTSEEEGFEIGGLRLSSGGERLSCTTVDAETTMVRGQLAVSTSDSHRQGAVQIGETVVPVRSVHRLVGTRFEVNDALGYELGPPEAPIAQVHTNSPYELLVREDLADDELHAVAIATTTLTLFRSLASD